MFCACFFFKVNSRAGGKALQCKPKHIHRDFRYRIVGHRPFLLIKGSKSRLNISGESWKIKGGIIEFNKNQKEILKLKKWPKLKIQWMNLRAV